MSKYRIADDHAIVARQDAPRFFDRIFLKLGQVNRGTDRRNVQVGVQIVAEILVQRLYVDFVRRVLPPAKLRVLQDGDQIVFEID